MNTHLLVLAVGANLGATFGAIVGGLIGAAVVNSAPGAAKLVGVAMPIVFGIAGSCLALHMLGAK